MTFATRPSEWAGTAEVIINFGKKEREIFRAKRLDSPNQLETSREFKFCAHAIFLAFRTMG
jgi:hypothetical protein